MLLLFETAAGFALFKVLKENKIQETEVRRLHGRLDYPESKGTMADGICITPQDLWQDFETLEGAQKVSCFTCFAPYLADLW